MTEELEEPAQKMMERYTEESEAATRYAAGLGEPEGSDRWQIMLVNERGNVLQFPSLADWNTVLVFAKLGEWEPEGTRWSAPLNQQGFELEPTTPRFGRYLWGGGERVTRSDAPALGRALVPIFPFFFLAGTLGIVVSAVVSIAAHFAVGASKSLVTMRKWWVSGAEMTAVALIVALVAYGLGRLLEQVL